MSRIESPLSSSVLDGFSVEDWKNACWERPGQILNVLEQTENDDVQKYLTASQTPSTPNLLEIAVSIAGNNRWSAGTNPVDWVNIQRNKQSLFDLIEFLVDFVLEGGALSAIVFDHHTISPDFTCGDAHVCDARCTICRDLAKHETIERNIKHFTRASQCAQGGNLATILCARLYQMARQTWSSTEDTQLPRIFEWIAFADLCLSVLNKMIEMKMSRFGRLKHIPGAIEFIMKCQEYLRKLKIRNEDVEKRFQAIFNLLDPFNQLRSFFATVKVVSRETLMSLIPRTSDFLYLQVSPCQAFSIRNSPPWNLTLSWVMTQNAAEECHRIQSHFGDERLIGDEKNDILWQLIQGRAILHPCAVIGLITRESHPAVIAQRAMAMDDHSVGGVEEKIDVVPDDCDTCPRDERGRRIVFIDLDEVSDSEDESEMEEKASDDVICFGLFAKMDIEANSPIAHFGGRVCVLGEREEDSTNMCIQSTYGGDESDTVLYDIDCKYLLSPAAFVNDHHGISAEPNCELTPICISGVNAVVVMTTRKVMRHEELVVSYGNEYYDLFAQVFGFAMTREVNRSRKRRSDQRREDVENEKPENAPKRRKLR